MIQRNTSVIQTLNCFTISQKCANTSKAFALKFVTDYHTDRMQGVWLLLPYGQNARRLAAFTIRTECKASGCFKCSDRPTITSSEQTLYYLKGLNGQVRHVVESNLLWVFCFDAVKILRSLSTQHFK